jgi:hypothetical protein
LIQAESLTERTAIRAARRTTTHPEDNENPSAERTEVLAPGQPYRHTTDVPLEFCLLPGEIAEAFDA